MALSAQDSALYFQSGQINVSGLTLGGFQGGSYGSNTTGGFWSPDFVAALRVDQAWGLVQASFAAHNNHVGYYGATEFTGHPTDKWGYAGQLALSIKNIPTGPGDTINVQGIYTDGASRYNFQSLGSTTYSIYGQSGIPAAYESLGIGVVADTVFAGTTSATGTSQQSVRTWGARGAFTHNWNPYWNSSLYGAYAAVDYGATGRGLICAQIAATAGLAAGITSCNPNFAIGQAGIITRWTPVKNLTFSADMLYTRLDQRYTGTITTAATQVATAKPAQTYQMRDQDTLTLLLRAQRNF